MFGALPFGAAPFSGGALQFHAAHIAGAITGPSAVGTVSGPSMVGSTSTLSGMAGSVS